MGVAEFQQSPTKQAPGQSCAKEDKDWLFFFFSYTLRTKSMKRHDPQKWYIVFQECQPER